jgi:hypothetical protein
MLRISFQRIVAVALVAAVLLALADRTVAQDEGTVTATVTPATISITAAEQHTDYGAVPLGAKFVQPTGQTSNANADAAFSVTNNGTFDVDLSIVGGDSADWTLIPQAAEGPGTDEYMHRISTEASSDGSLFGPVTSLHAAFEPVDSLAPDATMFFWLSMHMPESSTSTEQQSLPINITATLPD